MEKTKNEREGMKRGQRDEWRKGRVQGRNGTRARERKVRVLHKGKERKRGRKRGSKGMKGGRHRKVRGLSRGKEEGRDEVNGRKRGRERKGRCLGGEKRRKGGREGSKGRRVE